MPTVKQVKELISKTVSEHVKGKRLLKNGAEVNDPTPMEPPIGYRAEKSMFEVMREMITAEKARIAGLEEFDSPEEADDFEVGDDDEPTSPYEFDRIADLAEVERLRRALDVRSRELRNPSPAPSAPTEGSPSQAGGPASSTGPGKPA